MPEKKRFLHVLELGHADFAKEFQSEFQNAQLKARETGQYVKITATVLVSPPNPKNPQFAQCAYNVISTPQKPKPTVCTLEMNKEGVAIAEGTDIADLLQEELEFTELQESDNISPFNREAM